MGDRGRSALPAPEPAGHDAVTPNGRADAADETDLVAEAETWIQVSWQAEHLRRTADWLRMLAPDASLALVLAALTHDMERAYPGPDAPVFDARRGPADPDYLRRHQERSAAIVADWLKGRGCGEELVAEVVALVAVHEEGGSPEADLLQAADSLSFLEVNVGLFLERIPTRSHHVGPEEARAQFRYMYERIKVASARALARQMYEAAMARVGEIEATHGHEIGSPAEERR
jgi:hypothetical protein